MVGATITRLDWSCCCPPKEERLGIVIAQTVCNCKYLRFSCLASSVACRPNTIAPASPATKIAWHDPGDFCSAALPRQNLLFSLGRSDHRPCASTLDLPSLQPAALPGSLFPPRSCHFSISDQRSLLLPPPRSSPPLRRESCAPITLPSWPPSLALIGQYLTTGARITTHPQHHTPDLPHILT